MQVISRDPCLSGINAQARRLQKSRSRVASLFVDSGGGGGDMEALSIWRSLSEMDLMTMGKEAGRAQHGALSEDPEADKEALQLGTEKEETESSDDNTTQFSIHPPFDFPYFLLLQGYNHRQVRGVGGARLTSQDGTGSIWFFHHIIWNILTEEFKHHFSIKSPFKLYISIHL